MNHPEHPWRHLALLICILLLFAASPFVVTFRHGILVLNIIGTAVLVAGSYSLSERRHLFTIAIVLSGISIISTVLLLVFAQHWARMASHTCLFLLLAFFSISIFAYVLRSGRVTADKIFAAICVYMLIGFTWSLAYALADEIQPGSFAGPTEPARSDYVARIMQMRYFSFMTLTTVGYGDVVPRSPRHEPWLRSKQSWDSFTSPSWSRDWLGYTSSMDRIRPRRTKLPAPSPSICENETASL